MKTIRLVLWLAVDAELVQENPANDLPALLETIRQTGLSKFSILIREVSVGDFSDEDPVTETLQEATLVTFPFLDWQTRRPQTVHIRLCVKKLPSRRKGAAHVPLLQAQQHMLEMAQPGELLVHPFFWAALGQLGLELHGGWKALRPEPPPKIVPRLARPDRPFEDQPRIAY